MQFEGEYHGESIFADKPGSASEEVVREFPFNCVGVLYNCDGGDIQFIGTGFLIASNLVLTAAHNIYQDSKDSVVAKKNLQFFIGGSGDLSEKGHKVADYRCPPEFTSGSPSQNSHDYALIRLQDGVALPKYIRLGLEYISDDAEELVMIGFERGSCSNTQANLARICKAKTHAVNGNILMHKLSTVKGNSGSPIMVMRQGLQGPEWIAIAIMGHPPQQHNHAEARIITKQLLLNLNLWKLQMCPQIGYYVMSQRRTLIISDQHNKWIQEKNNTINQLIFNLKQSISSNNQIKIILQNPTIYPAQEKKDNEAIINNFQDTIKKSQSFLPTFVVDIPIIKRVQQTLNLLSSSNPSINKNQITFSCPPAKVQQKVELKDLVVSEEHFYEIAAKLQQMSQADRKRIASLSLQQNFVNSQIRKGMLYSSQMQTVNNIVQIIKNQGVTIFLLSVNKIK